MGEENKKIGKEEVIAKLKDDGDFDSLRLKIVRKLKDNEELRNNIIAAVRQSAAINRPGAESMKPRQLSDAIHDEIGNKVMNQISDRLWEIIRSDSEGGMRNEIKETVKSVYSKLVNPGGKEVGESSTRDVLPLEKGAESNGSIKRSAGRVDSTLPYGEPKEPPGFSLYSNHQSNHSQQQHEAEQHRPYENGPVKKLKQERCPWQNGQEQDDVDEGVPPGFSEDIGHKQSCDVSDDDPDVPPGFG